MIAASMFMALMQTDGVDHLFVFRANEKLQHVSVAGSFNGWNKDADPLILSGDGLTWTKHLKLRPGTYTYKFVLNGERWIVDPKVIRNVDDGGGNTNSELLVEPTTFLKPAKKGDGIITTSALLHLVEVPYLNYDRGRLTVSLQTRTNDIASIKLHVVNQGEIPMHLVGGDELYQRYAASFEWDRKHDLTYSFILDDGQGALSFGPKGLTSASEPDNSYSVRASKFQPFEVPSWVERSVIYQIFPDRFANGDTRNDPKDVQPWTSKPNYRQYLGGDVAGVEQHLNYLNDLGISTVYFNPVFVGPSNHRYETSDYFKVDPTFGTNQEFIKLTRDLRKHGIRTVLDGVFNHTSTSFPAFADVVKNGAESRFTGWYSFKSFPVRIERDPNYAAWFNFASMPKLNYGNPDVTAYMLGVPQYWQTKADVAGWRLDAANEVTSDYWRAFRSKVKSIDKNAWIVGEVWGDASQWLKGDQWDSVMNYPFRSAVLGLFGKSGTGRASELMNSLMRVYNSYAPQVSRNLMNVIGTHDTPRILTACGGDRDLAKLAAILQFTWVGTPSIYYGDELGMEGDRDPDNRRGMTWSNATPQNDFLSLYKKLIKTRNENPALQSGDPVPLLADDEKRVVAFARVLDGTADVIALNRSDFTQNIDLNLSTVAGLPKTVATVGFTNALTGSAHAAHQSILHLQLAPRSAAVLIPRLGSSPHLSHLRRDLSSANLATSQALAHKEPK